MAKIELEINDAVLERARRLAQGRHSPLDKLINDLLEQTTAQADADPLLGLFADEPELVDQLIASAMEARENHPLRLHRG
ncbi:MAG TPA: hypothetical protein VFB38_20885 [Chthonomonadaceae bacterium]|nr:hypothetical protein [Chthonomonadaceae bacterium]